MSTRKFFVGGNWKMNGSMTMVNNLVQQLNTSSTSLIKVEVVIAPPALYLSQVRKELNSSIGVAAQNCYHQNSGAFTGEISPAMIKELGVDYVILGHSERRTLFKETSELVAQKTHFALQQGLTVIACIGETAQERAQNQTWSVLNEQLTPFISTFATLNGSSSRLVLAYEPVWAIGTGQVATPEQAQEAHAFIRQWLKDHLSSSNASFHQECRIIYGGSVTAQNCKVLATQPDIDGFLVGGASLKPEFKDICMARQSE